jgi:hypothetical protein
MDDPERMMQALSTLFRKDADIPEEKIHAVEGAVEQGELSLKVLMVTDDFVLLRAWRGKEFIAEPGDVWRHPPGVPHFSEALEECVQLEIKSPARKTWT